MRSDTESQKSNLTVKVDNSTNHRFIVPLTELVKS